MNGSFHGKFTKQVGKDGFKRSEKLPRSGFVQHSISVIQSRIDYQMIIDIMLINNCLILFLQTPMQVVNAFSISRDVIKFYVNIWF